MKRLTFTDALGDDKEITLYIIINNLWRSKPPFPSESWLHLGPAPLDPEEASWSIL